jgi:membrane associated rhomboid family serine protease
MSLTQDIRDAFSRRDNALNQLIIINVLVFAVLIILKAIFFVAQSEWYVRIIRQVELSSDPLVVLRHPWTLLSYAFVHEDFWHILFNMLNLYWFGQLIREYLGDRRLVSLYILGALAGAVFFLLAYNLLPVFRGGIIPLIGASASVVAIIVAAATLLPDYTFMMFLLGAVKIKWIAAVVVVVLSIQPIYSGNPGGGIAHLGGALLGFVFIKQLKAGRDMGAPVTAVGNWFSRLFSQGSGMRVTHRQPVTTGARSASSSAKSSGAAVAGQDEIDLILDKISHSGYESLSKDEKQKLFRASQQ